MKIRVYDKKNKSYAYFQLGYGSGDKIFSIPSVLECLVFEVYKRDNNFNFNEEKSDYEIALLGFKDKFICTIE